MGTSACPSSCLDHLLRLRHQGNQVLWEGHMNTPALTFK